MTRRMEMVVACRIVRRRIASRTARRPITSRHISTRFRDLDVPAVFMVGRAVRPSSAMPRPNSACNRRRHRRYTNVYSFILPWRFIMARSAARLRRTVGPLASRKAVAGHGVAKGRRVRDDPSPDRVPSGASRAVWPVAGSRLVTSLPTPATARLCHVHGQASRTPVIGHAPAQHAPVADAATGGIRTFILVLCRGVPSRRVRRRG